MTAIHPDYLWKVVVDDEQHGELYEDGEACINAAVDLIGCPDELRPLFMSQLLSGKYADNGERKVWIEAVEREP